MQSQATMEVYDNFYDRNTENVTKHELFYCCYLSSNKFNAEKIWIINVECPFSLTAMFFHCPHSWQGLKFPIHKLASKHFFFFILNFFLIFLNLFGQITAVYKTGMRDECVGMRWGRNEKWGNFLLKKDSFWCFVSDYPTNFNKWD